MPFLDEDLASLYVWPSRHALDFGELLLRTKDRASRLELLAVLDNSGLLRLHPAGSLDPQAHCGLFAIPKSAEKDRLIIDARPNNLRFPSDSRWLAALATSANLLAIELAPDEDLLISGADVRDLYHNFKVSEDRLALYQFVGSYSPAEFSTCVAFTQASGDTRNYEPL